MRFKPGDKARVKVKVIGYDENRLVVANVRNMWWIMDEDDLEPISPVQEEESPKKQSVKNAHWKEEFIDWYLDPEQEWWESGQYPQYVPHEEIIKWIEQNMTA